MTRYQELAPRHDDLRQFMSVLKRQRRIILALVVILPALTLSYSAVVPARYTAWAQINLDPRGYKVMETEVMPTAFGNDTAIAESQLKIISSDAVLAPVVERFRLHQDPEFGPGRITRAVEAIRRAIQGGTETAEPDPKLQALRELHRRVTVRRAERTYIIDVGVWSNSPEQAAVLAQAIVIGYITDHKTARSGTVQEVAEFLTSRLDELRAALLRAEDAVENYKTTHNILSTRDVLTTEQQLADLNAQLAAASGRVAEAQARRSAIARVRQGQADPAASGLALNSPAIVEIRKQAVEVARTEAALAANLGPRHPALVEARQQARRVNGAVNEELERIHDSAKNDLDIAHAHEEALKQRIDVLRRDATVVNKALVGLRQLEREAQARRETYQAFLSRARLTSEQDGLSSSNARIITPARVPDRPSGPSATVLLAIALFAALFLGIAHGLLRERWSRVAEPRRTTSRLQVRDV